MTRPRLPLTPSMSGEFIIKEQPYLEGAESFALPPAALSPSKIEAASRRSSRSELSNYFLASPASPDLAALGRQTNPPRQTAKRPLEDLDLPPPPTRTRKIIQMKPKTQTPAKPAAAASKPAKEAAKAPANGAAPTNSKKKQPSATSAAGRKIARKTAHSLIERRRRSKMNEEFATLKNMIPACRGQEMHKLAILQASIDYVNYLEQCIQDLKASDGKKAAAQSQPSPAPPSPTSPEVLAGAVGSVDSTQVSPQLLPSGMQVNDTSPSFSPRSQVPSAPMTFEFAPTILPSPALGPTRSPETTMGSSQRPWRISSMSANASPALQPQRSSVSSYGADADIDHEASAALLMLNRDRRGTADSINDKFTKTALDSIGGADDAQDSQKKMGMSLRDLLIS